MPSGFVWPCNTKCWGRPISTWQQSLYLNYTTFNTVMADSKIFRAVDKELISPQHFHKQRTVKCHKQAVQQRKCLSVLCGGEPHMLDTATFSSSIAFEQVTRVNPDIQLNTPSPELPLRFYLYKPSSKKSIICRRFRAGNKQQNNMLDNTWPVLSLPTS